MGLTVKVVSEQRPEERRKSVMLTSGRIADQEYGWRGVSWRKEKGSVQRDKRFCRRLRGVLEACRGLCMEFCFYPERVEEPLKTFKWHDLT